MAKVLEFEVKIKSFAVKFWGAIRDFIDLFPKIFPDQYKSIEILEGDGKSVGSIRLVKYAEEYEKTSEEVPEPNLIQEYVVNKFNVLVVSDKPDFKESIFQVCEDLRRVRRRLVLSLDSQEIYDTLQTINRFEIALENFAAPTIGDATEE